MEKKTSTTSKDVPQSRPDEKAIQAFADLVVKKMESCATDWKQPWVNIGFKGLPENLDGRRYSGYNTLLLLFVTEARKYQTPVFTTFLQAKQNGLQIKKGEKAFPVFYYNFTIKHRETGQKITTEDWKKLSKDKQAAYKVIPFRQIHPVFNIEQTDIKEVQPELWEKLQNKYTVKASFDTSQVISCPAIDTMLNEQGWLCPIYVETRNDAFYSIRKDEIHSPRKEQFKDGAYFYTTIFHEMTHSTGSKGRLGRNFNNITPQSYGREELIAELTSVLVAASLGISATPKEENVAYLKNWCEEIKKEPKFILSILTDVNKASQMILDVTDKYQLIVEQKVKEEQKPQNLTKESYISKEGEQLQFNFVGENKQANYQQLTSGLQRQIAGSLASPGEFCRVERVFEESKTFDFTAGEKIESAEDVAYIFKKLEDAAVENSFAVLIKDEQAIVLHLGMGEYNSVSVNTSAIKVAADRINPDKIYFVHNHPSGALTPSVPDKNVWKNLYALLGDKLQNGIIINLKSGKFALYNENNWSIQTHKQTVEAEIPVKIFSFTKQVFKPDFDPSFTNRLNASEDVAAFISSHRLGDREKINVLILNSRLQAVGNILSPYTEISPQNTDHIAQYLISNIAVMGGTRAILYGDFSFNNSVTGLTKAVKEMSLGTFELIDTISIEGNHSRYINAAEQELQRKSLQNELRKSLPEEQANTATSQMQEPSTGYINRNEESGTIATQLINSTNMEKKEVNEATESTVNWKTLEDKFGSSRQPLTSEEKEALLRGESIHLSGLTARNGRTFDADVSIDPESNKFKYGFPEGETNRQPLQLSEEQQKALDAGEKVRVDGLTSKAGKNYDIVLFKNPETGKIEREWAVKKAVLGVELSQDQQKKLQNGEYLWVDGLKKKDGTTFKAPVIWNAKEGKFGFAQFSQDKAKEQHPPLKEKQTVEQRDETLKKGRRL